MGHFQLFSKYGQNFHFITHFDPPPPQKKKRVKKKMSQIVTNFFPTNKQYLKTKLMQNETNLWSSFLVKKKYW